MIHFEIISFLCDYGYDGNIKVCRSYDRNVKRAYSPSERCGSFVDVLPVSLMLESFDVFPALVDVA